MNVALAFPTERSENHLLPCTVSVSCTSQQPAAPTSLSRSLAGEAGFHLAGGAGPPLIHLANRGGRTRERHAEVFFNAFGGFGFLAA